MSICSTSSGNSGNTTNGTIDNTKAKHPRLKDLVGIAAYIHHRFPKVSVNSILAELERLGYLHRKAACGVYSVHTKYLDNYFVVVIPGKRRLNENLTITSTRGKGDIYLTSAGVELVSRLCAEQYIPTRKRRRKIKEAGEIEGGGGQ